MDMITASGVILGAISVLVLQFIWVDLKESEARLKAERYYKEHQRQKERVKGNLYLEPKE